MKILRAPNDHTLTRVTSVGEVVFENGIATEFTKEQEQFFTERQRGYEIQDIEETPPETNEPKQADDSSEPKQADSEAGLEKDAEGYGDEPTPEEEESGKTEDSEPPTDASQDAPDGTQAAPPATSSDEGTEGHVADGEDKSATPTDESDGEEAGPEERQATGDGEGIGSAGEEGSASAETIILPTIRDKRRRIAKWCRTNGVDDKGTKRELLERIYADKRFKK